MLPGRVRVPADLGFGELILLEALALLLYGREMLAAVVETGRSLRSK